MARKRKRRRGKGAGAGSAQLRPAALPPDPSQRVQWVVSRSAAGVRVNEDNALTVPAVWAAVRLLSESLAALPWHVHRRRADGGRDAVPGHPADMLLHVQANEETSAFHHRVTALAHALLWGNGYSEIEPDLMGNPAALWQITPNRVRPVRSLRTQEIEYEVQNGTGSPKMVPMGRMFHLRGLGFDGLVGYSVVSMAARSLGTSMAQETYAASFFANDASPAGLLKTGAKLTKQAEEQLQQSWQRAHGGPYRKGSVAVLHGGLEWQPLGMPNEDAQFLQSRQFSIAEVARWFNVPPHKIGDLSRSTFSNIDAQELAFVIDSLMPWIRALESEADMKLIAPRDRGKLFTRINVMGRLRGDIAARTAHYTAMMDRGVYSVNDVLRREDENPIGPDGDKRLVPLNMQLLEDAGEEEEEPPAPEPPEPEPEEEEGEEGEDEEGGEEELRAALMRSLGPLWQRLLDSEAACLRKMAKRGALKRADVSGFLGEQGIALRASFDPVLCLACKLRGGDAPAPPDLLDELAKRYLENLRARLDADGVPRWDGLSWLVGALQGRNGHAGPAT